METTEPIDLKGRLDTGPKATKTYRKRGMANMLRMGHCAPTVMKTLLDIHGVAKEWPIKLVAGMPGGIGNTGFECGGFTAPLVALGLRHGLRSQNGGLPSIFYEGHGLCQRFQECNGTLLCSAIRGHDRLPRGCIKVIRHAPELYAETLSHDGRDGIPGETCAAYSALYAHLREQGFHCAHAVFEQLSPTIPASPELRDATSAFVGGTLFKGMTCSAFAAGVMAVGLALSEIEDSRARVLRMIATMIAGGDIAAERLNKFNRSMNLGAEMSHWFTREFGSTQCREITQCDFGVAAGVRKYIDGDGVATCRALAAKVAAQVQELIGPS